MSQEKLNALSPEEAAEREATREYVNALPYTWHKKPVYEAVKRFFDILLSGLLLLFIWPVYLLIALLIKLDDGGKVF